MSEDQQPANTYVMPTESGSEMARLIDQDIAITRVQGGAFPSELDLLDVRRILDVACGPGGWARLVAQQLPDTEVVGIDLSKTMIEYARAYAHVQKIDNVRFLEMNVLHPLQFPDASFDLVNARFMAAFLPAKYWPGVIREFVRITRPGGFIVLTECDDWGMTNGTTFERHKILVTQAMARAGLSQHPHGLNMCATPMLGQHLQAAGCQQIQQRPYVLNYSAGTPANPVIYENFQAAMKLGQPFVVKMGVAQPDELDDLYERVSQEMLDENFRALWYFLTVWGVKG